MTQEQLRGTAQHNILYTIPLSKFKDNQTPKDAIKEQAREKRHKAKICQLKISHIRRSLLARPHSCHRLQ